MMSEKEKDAKKYQCNGFYMKIDDELKKKFNIKCLENGRTMAEVIKESMENYISQ